MSLDPATDEEQLPVYEALALGREIDRRIDRLAGELLATLRLPRNRQACTYPDGRARLWQIVDESKARLDRLRAERREVLVRGGLPDA